MHMSSKELMSDCGKQLSEGICEKAANKRASFALHFLWVFTVFSK